MPTYAALNLLVFPYWGNVVAVRSHLYPAIAGSVNARDLFALRSGFLWWPDGHAPAGFWPAAIFLVIALASALVRLAVTDDPGDDEVNAVWAAIITPVASAFVPFVLTLFMTLWAFGNLVMWGTIYLRRVGR